MRDTEVNMQNTGHNTSRRSPAAFPLGADPRVTHATDAYAQPNHDNRQTLRPPDSRSGKRKRRDCEDDERYSHESTKRRRSREQATSKPAASTSRHRGYGGISQPSDSSVSANRHLSLTPPHEQHQARQQQQRSFSDDVLRYLDDDKCLNYLLRKALRTMFKVSRRVISRRFDHKGRDDGHRFERNLPTGRSHVGKILLCIIPHLRGDSRSDNEDNVYQLPGPYGTQAMFKITPCVLVNNDLDDRYFLKLLTTRHNTSLENLRRSAKHKRDYVQMRRTPGGNQIDDSYCLASLDFVGTSETFKYQSPCFMEVIPTHSYPRRCPYMELGYLVQDERNLRIFNEVLMEGNDRLIAPSRLNLEEASAKALATPTLSSHDPFATRAGPSRTRNAVSTQGADTTIPKTRPPPADPDAEPQLAQKTFPTILPPSIDKLTLLECFRRIGATQEQYAFMNDAHAQTLAPLRKAESSETRNDAQSLDVDINITDTPAQKGKGKAKAPLDSR